MSFDQIADMLSRIRNAQKAGKADVSMPASRLKEAIAKVLYRQGYVSEVTAFSEGNKNFLRIALKYNNNQPVIQGIKRISRPGQRVYVGKKEIPQVKNGYGIVIISTSKGILTGEEARQKGIGGEVVCEVW